MKSAAHFSPLDRSTHPMRTLMKVTMPVGAGTPNVKDGTIERILGETASRLRPEAAYFYPENGHRTAIMVFDLKSPSDLPTITEPLFAELNAAVEMFPVMNAEDLKKGVATYLEQNAALHR
jgi:hypothetical protein